MSLGLRWFTPPEAVKFSGSFQSKPSSSTPEPDKAKDGNEAPREKAADELKRALDFTFDINIPPSFRTLPPSSAVSHSAEGGRTLRTHPNEPDQFNKTFLDHGLARHPNVTRESIEQGTMELPGQGLLKKMVEAAKEARTRLYTAKSIEGLRKRAEEEQ